MKLSYLGAGTLCAALTFAGFPTVLAHQHPSFTVERIKNNSDSLKIESLAKELKKLKPLSAKEFKGKFKKEINGFKLTEVDAYEDKKTGSSAMANYVKGSQNIYMMVKDGAGSGSNEVKQNLISYLELKEFEKPGDKTNIISYKGWMVYFDHSMFENDGITGVHYPENNRYSIIASGNTVSLPELKDFLDQFSLQ